MTARLFGKRPRLKLFGLVLLLALGLVLLVPVQDARSLSFESQYENVSQLFSRGYLEKSQNAAERAYLRSQTTDPTWAARFQLLEAQSMVWRGLYDNAEHILESNPPIPDDPEREILRQTLEAVSLTRLQRLSGADQRLTEASEICLQQVVKACGEVPRARGVLAMQRGDFAAAKAFFFESLQYARSHNDKWLETTALLNLGTASLQQEHYDEAGDWCRSANRAAVDLQAEDLAQRSLGNLGWAYFGLGDKARALDLFLDAQHHARILGDVSTEVSWLTTTGDVYWNTGDFIRATQSYSHALSLAKQIRSKEDIVNTLEDLAHASIDAGKLEEANGYLQQLGPFLSANSNRLDELDVTLAQGRIAAAKRNDKDAEALFRIVEKDPASQTSMRLGAEHELALLYESEGRTADADRMYRTSLGTFEAARADLKNEESKLPFLANATGVYDDYIHFLVAQHKTDEALALADRSRARTLEQGLGVTTDARTAANTPLHPGEIARNTNATLLFYWLGEHESYLWAISPAKTSMFTLPARSRIEPMVERYRKALLGLADPLEASNGDGLALYRTLVAPARELIRPASTVVILNDGVLSELDFETLIAPEPIPHYWIEDATLISAPSLHLLASSKPAERGGNKLLLVGDAISPNPDYPELPKAATEMKQIELHFSSQDETVFARERATAGSYLSSTPQQFSYIHFVAHGVASRTDPLDSAIILSRSTAEEDSFKLHARDIMQHPIHARLVTISACYGSGTRSYVGEGLVGLAWAFMRAGAHNVIGALWEVSDESTPRLMGSLYQGLEDGMPPAAALRRAKLELLHAKGEFRKPFFWAPLQIYTGL
jgi:CHAT domain-containing protein/Tfp pilus assembly protein PilF